MGKSKFSGLFTIAILLVVISFIIYFIEDILIGILAISMGILFLIMFISIEALIIFSLVWSLKELIGEIKSIRHGIMVNEVKLILHPIIILSAISGFCYIFYLSIGKFL